MNDEWMKEAERLLDVFQLAVLRAAATPSAARVTAYDEARAALLAHIAQRPTTQASVYAWLGFWRDKLPAEAVESLQRMLGPLLAAPQPESIEAVNRLTGGGQASDGGQKK